MQARRGAPGQMVGDQPRLEPAGRARRRRPGAYHSVPRPSPATGRWRAATGDSRAGSRRGDRPPVRRRDSSPGGPRAKPQPAVRSAPGRGGESAARSPPRRGSAADGAAGFTAPSSLTAPGSGCRRRAWRRRPRAARRTRPCRSPWSTGRRRNGRPRRSRSCRPWRRRSTSRRSGVRPGGVLGLGVGGGERERAEHRGGDEDGLCGVHGLSLLLEAKPGGHRPALPCSSPQGEGIRIACGQDRGLRPDGRWRTRPRSMTAAGGLLLGSARRRRLPWGHPPISSISSAAGMSGDTDGETHRFLESAHDLDEMRACPQPGRPVAPPAG